ncbi:chemotaxis protein [Breoghania sp. L-A4]|nr:chemotaxis protein [Breoghania sp. L-A4]
MKGQQQTNGPAARDAAAKLNDPTRAVAEDFEAVFLQNMFNAMFETVEGGGTFGDSNASETWRGMLAEEYAKTVVKAGGIGIAESVQSELIALQEGHF